MNEIVESVLRCNCATMTCLKTEESLKLQNFLAEQGYHVCISDLDGVTDEIEIFLRIVASLPLGDVYARSHRGINMASLDDLMIDILNQEPKLALTVMNADILVEHHLNMLLTLFSIFILQTIRSKKFDSRSLITTFLIGSGPNFQEKLIKQEQIAKPKRPHVRTAEQVKQDREGHWRKLQEGTLPWQQNMTDDQKKHVEKMIERGLERRASLQNQNESDSQED